MREKYIKKMVFSAIFITLVFVSTYIIRIPSPINGYVNLGDGFVLASGWLLGPVFGPISAGIGSMFTDLLSGYSVYAPATLIIKSLDCLIATLIYDCLKRKNIGVIVGGILGELFMVLGYFLFSYFILGNGISAALNITGDLFQGVVGVVLGIMIMKISQRSGLDVIIRGEK